MLTYLVNTRIKRSVTQWLYLFIFWLSFFFSIISLCTSRLRGDWADQSPSPTILQLLPPSSLTTHSWSKVVSFKPLHKGAPTATPPSPRALDVLLEKTPPRTGNCSPITPPRQQHEYNKHVIKPASKILPRAHPLHLPSPTHLPTPLSKPFTHARCHLESQDTATAPGLTGYQETLFTGVCEENCDFGDEVSCHRLYSARCSLWPGSRKALKHLGIP